ncbi:hypothetical protein [Erythrobacter sp.]|uniref:hypothetical protein n=1 Tax=Erythrobacter sp. TaxID=1042 RepID=UPI001425F84B|nr:hypothetical protein [Erythrobacter sp.]QIQ87076.1 MAG: hypothetical protein G9473_10555 [Erythrobacter sp.]
MSTTTKTPARAGRERTCHQCGTTYRSPRNSSRYCSPACRKRAARGTAPTGGPKAGPSAFSPITKALYLTGYVGPIGPTSRREDSPTVYGLLVDREAAFAELVHQFDRKDWGIVSREEFDAALKADGIVAFTQRSPEAAARKRRSDIRRQRIKRAI